MIEVSPVLTFAGNCEEAFEYYKSVFGGDYQFLYRYKDVDSENSIDGNEEKILHVSLPLMKNVYLMGADSMEDPKLNIGESILSVGLRLNDKDETFHLFDALSTGGQILIPLKVVFYADYYGLLIDRFGVRWTFNCNIGRELAI